MSLPTFAEPAAALPGGGAIPLLGFGTWQTGGDACYRAVTTALESGYRHLDTAAMYENEAEVGRALSDSGVPREEVFVTTKLLPSDADHARDALQRSLDALGLEDVDLYLVHWPPGGANPSTWEQLLGARDAGQARAVGVSNYDIDQVDELIAATQVAPAVNQVRWGPALHDPTFLAQSADRGVVVEGYSPFRSTDLDHPVLDRIARAHEVTPAQVVVRWHLEHGVVVIPKSVHPDRIRANADVFGFSLTEDEIAQVDRLGAS